MTKPLPVQFYARECLEVALDLLGKSLCHGAVVLRITEVEAYRHPGDSANHCRAGQTPRNAPMWGPPGCAYVYLCYGVHALLNLVTDQPGQGAAVLIRACEPLRGLSTIQRRRGQRRGPELLNGPGKVSAALAVDRSLSGTTLLDARGLHVRDAPRATQFLAGPRIGVDYAQPRCRMAPWRLALPDTPWVSHPGKLTRWPADADSFLREQSLSPSG